MDIDAAKLTGVISPLADGAPDGQKFEPRESPGLSLTPAIYPDLALCERSLIQPVHHAEYTA